MARRKSWVAAIVLRVCMCVCVCVSLSLKAMHYYYYLSLLLRNAWAKSGQKFEQGKKCQNVLEKMIAIALSKDGKGRDIAPDTKSFNIVLNALAQSRERNSEIRAEELLQRMELLSSDAEETDVTPMDCRPDETSFNTVLNAWASSRQRGAADRTIAILDHMKKRHNAGLTEVHPDESTYNTGKSSNSPLRP